MEEISSIPKPFDLKCNDLKFFFFRLKQLSEDLFPKGYQGMLYKFKRLTRPTHYSFRQGPGLENPSRNFCTHLRSVEESGISTLVLIPVCIQKKRLTDERFCRSVGQVWVLESKLKKLTTEWLKSAQSL